jgi:hypothetical protein
MGGFTGPIPWCHLFIPRALVQGPDSLLDLRNPDYQERDLCMLPPLRAQTPASRVFRISSFGTLLLRPDGVLEQDVRITLKTDDGAFIYVRYAGMRHGPPEVMARLAQGETVDPSEYYFRVAPMFETGAERYAWLNKILAVGVGERLPPNMVRYAIFEIL